MAWRVAGPRDWSSNTRSGLMNQSPSGPDGPQSGKRRLSRRDLIQTVVVAGVIGAVVGISGAIGRANQDPYERAIEEAGTALMELPGFDDRFDTSDEEAAFEAGAQLGMAAIPRLSDREFSEYLRITHRMFRAVDDDVCASLALGTVDEEGVLEGIRSLEIDTVRRYVELLVAAARVELAGGRAPPPTQAEAQAAFDELATKLGAARLSEMGAIYLDPAEAGDERLCAVTRDLYGALVALPPDTTRVIFRSLFNEAPAT